MRPKRKLKLKLKHLTVALKLLTVFKVSTPGMDLAVLKDLEPLFMVYMVSMVEPLVVPRPPLVVLRPPLLVLRHKPLLSPRHKLKPLRRLKPLAMLKPTRLEIPYSPIYN